MLPAATGRQFFSKRILRMKKLLRYLRSMRFGILLLCLIAACSVAGTLIPQGREIAWYARSYASAHGIILLLRLNRVFESWYFIALLVLLGLNLSFCSLTRIRNVIRSARGEAERTAGMPDTVLLNAEGMEKLRAYLEDMFGLGCWKYSPELAEKLFIEAGLEKKDDGWYFDGKPFTLHLTYLANTEAQAGRGVEAAYDQLSKFGFNCEISSESSATFDTVNSTGEYELRGIWPTGFITKDIYSQISGWDADLITPLGERSSGQGTRWNNAKATEIIHEMAKLDPNSEESYQLGIQFLENAIEEMPFIGFHSGVKFVPTNSSVWEGYPTADNPYNGPWWWWSCFKYIAPYITPVQK